MMYCAHSTSVKVSSVSVQVLGAYVAVFMVGLPVIVVRGAPHHTSTRPPPPPSLSL